MFQRQGTLTPVSSSLFNNCSAPDTNVSHKILTAGWAKVHDSNSRRNNENAATPEEDETGGWKATQRSIQETAQSASLGIWGPDDLLHVDHSMGDAAAFLAEWKGKEVESVVEQVRDGSMLRVRMLTGSRHHQMVNLSLAGIKAPRLMGGGGPNSGEPSEPFAEEARFFVESRLMQRNVKVIVLAMPQPLTQAVNPLGSAASAPPQPPMQSSVLIGQVLHPVGDIAQFLLAAGLARCVDWHSGLLASVGGMEKYRLAEKAAKAKRLAIWKDYNPPPRAADATGPGAPAQRTFEATVVRVISGDTIHVRRPSAPEQRIHLSSVRQPNIKDPKLVGYANEAREALRKRLVGKAVQVHIDYAKKDEGNGEERVYATVKTTTGSKEARGQDVGEMLISRGLATVIRHRAGDEDRSPEWDRYMASEAEAIQATRGLHSGKEATAPRLIEASESASKANTYLPVLKRQGRIHAVVDFCASASRFKIVVPKESCRLTFVLAGIRAPRTARNASEKDEPYAREGFDFTTTRALQRDVEVEVYSTDKAGGFIGALWLNKTENLAVSLVESGWASVHQYSAEGISFGSQLIEAEKRARRAKVGMWVNETDEEQHESVGDIAVPTAGANGSASASAATAPRKAGWGVPAAAAAPAQARSEYVDLYVSDVRGGSGEVPFGFSVQILDPEISKLETLMSDLALHHKAATTAFSSAFAPKVGDWVSAKFSGDGAWYRGQILRNKAASKSKEVRFVDYGNIEDVAVGDIRPLEAPRFGKARLPAKAIEARLSFAKLYAPQPQPGAAAASASTDEYAQEAVERFRDLTEGKKLIANIDYR